MSSSACFLLVVLLLLDQQFKKHSVDGRRAFSCYRTGDIILGGLFDVHTSGNDAERCGDVLASSLGYTEAMVFAIDSINRNKTLLPNITLGFNIQDYCLRPENAVRASYELVVMSDPRFSDETCSRGCNVSSSSITAVIGPVDSTSATIVSSLFQVAHIPSISPLASSLELSSTLYSHFYRTIAPDNWRASLMADMAQFFNWTYVAAVALDDSFGRYGIWGIEGEAYKRNDFCIALKEFLPRTDHYKALQRIVSNLKSYENVNAVFFWLYGEYARSFMQEALRQGLKGRTWIFADAATLRDPFFSDVKFGDIMDGSLGILPKAGASMAFQKYLTNFTEHNFTGLPWWGEFWRSRKKYSANVKSLIKDIQSPYISYTIDAVYAIANALHNMQECTEPNGLLEGGRCPTVHPHIKGDELDHYIRKVRFQGLSGEVAFDEYGDPLEARYDITNLRRRAEESSEVLVGWWNKNSSPRLHLDVSVITWNGKNGVPLSVCSKDCQPGERKISKSLCCWECTKCPPGTISTEVVSSNCTECPESHRSNEQRTKCIKLPLKTLEWTDAVVVIATVLTAAGFVLSLLCFAVIFRYRNSPIIIASNKELSFVLMCAVGSFFILAFLNLLTPTDPLCRTINNWRYTAYTVCVSVLLLKSRKIVKAFQVGVVSDGASSRKKQKCLTVKGQRFQFIILLSLELLLAANWSIFDPPTKATIIRPLQYTFVVCKPFHTDTGKYLLFVIAGYVLSLSIMCIYYAFKGRKIPENFNEAKYIGFSMYILLLSSAAYYPVEFALEAWYVGVVGSMVTLVGSFSLLGCMFGPKVFVILFHPEQNTRAALSSNISNYSFSTPAAITSMARSAPLTSATDRLS